MKRPNILAIVMLGGGIILLYSAIKNKDPRDVVRGALGVSPVTKSTPSTPNNMSPTTPAPGAPSLPTDILPPGTPTLTV
jgi:hypothetical protein